MWKSMERMHGVEEMHWDHAQIPVSTVYQCYLVFSATCIVFAAWTASQEQPLHENNFVEFLDQLMRDRAKWTNGTIYISEVIDSLNPGHPLHLLYNRTQLRYDFGTSYYNYCKLRLQPKHSLPSLLRVMEMKIAPQAYLRAAVLAGLLIKMVFCMAETKTRFVYSSRATAILWLSRACPFLQIASDTALMLIVCLHQDQDSECGFCSATAVLIWPDAIAVKQMMYFHIPIFSVLFFFQGCIYSLLEICKPISNSDIALFIVRVLGFGVFAVSIPSVYEAYLSYLQLKPCHTHVSPSTAIKEYLCICVIVLFSLSQVCDYNPLVMNLTALRYDTIPSDDRTDYSPDFMTSNFDSAPFASMRTWKVSSTI